MALARLALYLCSYECKEVDITQQLTDESWHSMLKEMVNTVVLGNRPVVLNIRDNQMSTEEIMLSLDCLLKNGHLPDLFMPSEVDQL